ncbi:hypothetical protein BC826DRAFT_593598 [Russula brevipes]|nr:hypothetical protein BC826DRAFT_593598 [Russula brevipes]
MAAWRLHMVTVWDVPCPHSHVSPISAWKTTRNCGIKYHAMSPMERFQDMEELSGIERDAPWLDVFLLADRTGLCSVCSS